MPACYVASRVSAQVAYGRFERFYILKRGGSRSVIRYSSGRGRSETLHVSPPPPSSLNEGLVAENGPRTSPTWFVAVPTVTLAVNSVASPGTATDRAGVRDLFRLVRLEFVAVWLRRERARIRVIDGDPAREPGR
jgi:hypothetical protein